MIIVPPPPSGFADFTVRLALDEVQYQITQRYCARSSQWFMGLADTNGSVIVEGLPLVVGGYPLLHHANTPGVPGGTFYVLDTRGSGVEAGETELGSRVLLVYITEAELAEIRAEAAA